MKAYGNYIGTAYKYGLLTYPDHNMPYIRNKLRESFEYHTEDSAELELIEERKTIELKGEIIPQTIIPFEDIDGLTVGELGDYNPLRCTNNYLVFVMYDSMIIPGNNNNNTFNVKLHFQEPQEQGIIRFMYIIDIRKYEDVNIDEVIEEHLIKNLNKFNLQNRKRALSFLEKYVYGNRADVNNIIRNYINVKSEETNKQIYFSDYMSIPGRILHKEIEEKKAEQKKKLISSYPWNRGKENESI